MDTILIKNQITADNARNITSTIGKDTLFEKIFDTIRAGASNGIDVVRYQFVDHTPDETKKTIVRKLEELGYHVETTSISIYIKW